MPFAWIAPRLNSSSCVANEFALLRLDGASGVNDLRQMLNMAFLTEIFASRAEQ